MTSVTRNPKIGRIEGFDVLRGLCAIGVASYHMLYWTNVAKLFVIGTYGVYIFFVLSGASMTVAYSDRFNHGYPSQRFLAARFARLAPLICLVLAVGAVDALLSGRFTFDVAGLFILNASLLFGLGNPGATSVFTGGWSLGIEFLFYLIFPVLLSLTDRRSTIVVLILTFCAQQIFVNYVLRGEGTLATHWNQYTQPLSFVFYFAAGCGIGSVIIRGAFQPTRLSGVVLVALLGMFAFSSSSSAESTLTGLAGIALCLTATATVIVSAMLEVRGVGLIVGRALGNASYGIYLLHPILFSKIGGIWPSFRDTHPMPFIVFLVVVTAVAALVLERWFERPIRYACRRYFGSSSKEIAVQ